MHIFEFFFSKNTTSNDEKNQNLIHIAKIEKKLIITNKAKTVGVDTQILEQL